jgi:hypothetical protein
MEPSQPDVMEQLPAGGNPMQPQSGTYGEGAALDRLKAELPVGPAGQAVGPAPTPPGMPQGPSPAGAPTGLPQALMRPTGRPDVPVSTPLATPTAPPTAVVNAAQQRLQILDLLAESPEVSEETRAFAKRVREMLIGRG